MMCPKCHGKGLVPMYMVEHVHIEGVLAGKLTKCDYDGCVNGIVHCCDGLQNNETEKGDF
jgi:hypothetical protein|tara:strand:+ start:281 stop:460 length:180 start_codon:yes stop_codon:yes gene_type:complete